MIPKAIKTHFANADMSAGTSFFVNPNINFVPDLAVVRQISFNGTGAQQTGNFLVWSSLTNDFIGAFNIGGYSASVNPLSQILLNRPVPNTVQFQIYVVNGGTVIPATLTGNFSIQIEYIKY
jgi:hypothetical protein